VNLFEAMQDLREKDHLIGVYSELVTHLEGILRDEGQIPIHNSTEEFVDEGYINEVLDGLRVGSAELLNERKKILEWKVDRGEDRNEDGGEAPEPGAVGEGD
jgi:hypothetical protein